MTRKTGTLLLFGLLTLQTKLYSQNGYKEFNWGDDIKTVKGKALPLHKESWDLVRGLQVAYYIQNGNLGSDEQLADPLEKAKGKLEYYLTKDKDMTFTFFNGKLVAVKIVFYNERVKVIDDLQKKYGVCASKFMTYGSLTIELKAWFTSPSRVIAYEYDDDWKTETVSYIAQNFYEEFAGKLKAEQMKELNKRQKKRNEKID
jgi:hypothetical protein